MLDNNFSSPSAGPRGVSFVHQEQTEPPTPSVSAAPDSPAASLDANKQNIQQSVDYLADVKRVVEQLAFSEDEDAAIRVCGDDS